MPESLLAEGFRREVLGSLVRKQPNREELRAAARWHRSSFSAHNRVRVSDDDCEGRTKLAGYDRSKMHLGVTPGDAGCRVGSLGLILLL